MGLREFQSAMARLYTDAKLRADFSRDPQEVAKHLELPAEDLDRWLAISQQEIDTFSEALVRKRTVAVRSLLPTCARVLGTEFDARFAEWAAETAATGVDHHLRDAIHFAAHLLREPSEWSDRPDWHADVLRWEQALIHWRLHRYFFRWMKFDYDVLLLKDVADTLPPSRRRVSVWMISCYGYRAWDYALRHFCYDDLFPGNAERRAVLAMLETADLEDVEMMCRTQAIDANLLQRALLKAVDYEDIARTELLLKMGAPANCQRSYGRSPLMQAACRAHLDLVKLLLRFGADPAYQDHEGQTALSEMATCVPGLKMTELLFGEEYAEEVLGKERLMEIKAAQGEIERLMINKIANI